MVQPQETYRPSSRAVLGAYVTITAATYTAKAGDRVDRITGINAAPRSQCTSIRIREPISLMAQELIT